MTLHPAGPYNSGQKISISVGPNHYFERYTRIIVIECAYRGHVPKNDSTCDGNTAPGFSILVNKNGSFSTSQYELFSLPNAKLGEAPIDTPVCNRTHPCVLYIGQNQNDFTSPKVFSAPLVIQSAGAQAKS